MHADRNRHDPDIHDYFMKYCRELHAAPRQEKPMPESKPVAPKGKQWRIDRIKKAHQRVQTNTAPTLSNAPSPDNVPAGQADDTKRCARCKDTKPLSQFYSFKRKQGGRRISPYCKPCYRAKNKEWRTTKKKSSP